MQAHQERDAARLEELVADGFRFTAIHLHPEPMTREQWMGAALGGYQITTFAFEEMEIDVFGETAVVHSRYSQIASYSTVNLSNVFRLTDVWSQALRPLAGRRPPLVRAGLSASAARVVVEPAPALAAEQPRLDHPVEQRRRDRRRVAELVVERLARRRAACRARSGRPARAAPSGARSP